MLLQTLSPGEGSELLLLRFLSSQPLNRRKLCTGSWSGSKRDILNNNNNDVFYSKIIDEKYPSYNAVIPEENPLTLTANKSEMLNNIRAASIATNKNTNQILLHLTEGKVHFKSVLLVDSKKNQRD